MPPSFAEVVGCGSVAVDVHGPAHVGRTDDARGRRGRTGEAEHRLHAASNYDGEPHWFSVGIDAAGALIGYVVPALVDGDRPASPNRAPGAGGTPLRRRRHIALKDRVGDSAPIPDAFQVNWASAAWPLRSGWKKSSVLIWSAANR